MFDEHKQPKQGSWFKRIFFGIGLLLVIFVITSFLAYNWYNNNIKAVDPSNPTTEQVNIAEGTSASAVAEQLSRSGLIKSQTAFELYLRLNNKRNVIQAGDYQIAPNMDVAEIVEILSFGVKQAESFTILPGKRLDQIEQALLDAGYQQADVLEALEPSNYQDHPISAYKPEAATLEGYIFPETFLVDENTTAKDIIKRSLDELVKKLSPTLRGGFDDQGVTVHEAIILASIVELEVAKAEEKALVAQVFHKRLREGISLGSDPTYRYAAAITGQPASPSLDNPYNTRIYAGLPPGPISNMDFDSLQAVANPADTEYLYFVSGDDGITRFNFTLEEHQRDTALYCIELCKL